MNPKPMNLPLIKLPSQIEHTLYLIKEELKSRKFFDSLRAIGLEDCWYHPDLSILILGQIGFKERPDELYNFYYDLLGEYSERVEPDNDVIMELALQIHAALVAEKKKSME